MIITSAIQILPEEFKVVRKSTGTTTWSETNWSAEENYSKKFQVKIEPDTGDVKLLYDQWLYVCEEDNARVDRTMIDGSGWTTYGTEGSGVGYFKYPTDIFYDKDSEFIYVTDSGNQRIVKTKINGTGWTTYGSRGYGKGQFYFPCGIWKDDSSNHLYVADTNNNRIVRTTMNGSGWSTFGFYGTGSTAGNFRSPMDIMTVGKSYTDDGYLISKKIDLKSPVDLLTIKFLADVPYNTPLKFQIRSAHNESALDGKFFVGPNGGVYEYTNSTYV